jgi:hypothetical protein
MNGIIVGFMALLAAFAAKIVLRNARLAKIEEATVKAMSYQGREDYLAKKRAASDLERNGSQERSDRWAYGNKNAVMTCPHCNTKGQIRTKIVEKKRGIGGGKATASILIGGISLLGTGLLRKERVTQARCGNCTSQWSF